MADQIIGSQIHDDVVLSGMHASSFFFPLSRFCMRLASIDFKKKNQLKPGEDSDKEIRLLAFQQVQQNIEMGVEVKEIKDCFPTVVHFFSVGEMGSCMRFDERQRGNLFPRF